LAWKIAESTLVTRLFCAPGNAGIAEDAECVPIAATDNAGLIDFSRRNGIDFVVVGPEAPLVAGLVDALEGEGIAAFGPSAAAAALEGSNPVAWRNLGIARFNVRRDPAGALAAYRRAREADPSDARLLYEHDQLLERTGAAPAERLAELEAHPGLVARRDDLSVELCALLLQAGRPEEALRRLTGRRFQPWEGGEGLVLEQHTRARLALARGLVARGDLPGARAHLEAALRPPESLGEARHPLASASDVLYALGDVCARMGDEEGARRRFEGAAASGDFRGMSVRAFSDLTHWSAQALGRLGRAAEREALLLALEEHAAGLLASEARVDYFATSLPTMLLFEDDLQKRQEVGAHVMLAQARLGLGDPGGARRHLAEALRRDPSHAVAGDLLRELGAG
jgi:tetratricopeptide (TPR) repeat protein